MIVLAWLRYGFLACLVFLCERGVFGRMGRVALGFSFVDLKNERPG